jgi:hypothetical protein
MTWWRALVAVGFGLLLTAPAIACGPGYTGEDITKAYKEGYEEGYDAGYAAGTEDCESQEGDTESAPAQRDETDEPPTSAISWDEAIDHVGERATVCGPVVGTHWASGSSGKPTFLNLGRDYPSSERFVVIIWEDSRANFPEPPEEYYSGKTVCVEGLIIEYEGIAEIEATSPGQIQEQ